MAFAAGMRLGSYEILAPLGAGGMGEVYRARDTKLGREVALKTLPPEVAGDAERLARFQREAQLLASLNHPHIAAIHGLEEANGQPFLVLELVEGEDLAQRLERGRIPVDEALAIARQIAEALEEAHANGIVHRDLKPANVKLTPDEKVKVLDFGLAKAWAGDPVSGSSSDLSQSPTLAHTGTQAGVILGTAAYMSPEQAKGRAVDSRSDVFSFGALLYEMLSGERAHRGDSVAETLAAVLKESPSFDRLPAATPPAVRHLLSRCLDKDRRHRLQHIGEARIVLERPEEAPAGSVTATRPAARERVLLGVAAVGVVAAALGWGAFAFLRPTAPPALPAVFTVDPPDGWSLADGGFEPDGGSIPMAVSPDGRRVAFVAVSGEEERVLWVRRLSEPQAQPLNGTEGAWSPFWSPDSQALAFFAGGKLKKVDLSGGAVTAICDVPPAALASGQWRSDGSIHFNLRTTEAFTNHVVPASGGRPRVLSSTAGPVPSAGLLPDGRHLLDVEFDPEDDTGRAVVQLIDSNEVEVVVSPVDSRPILYSQGHILFRRQSALLAQPFDPKRLETTGEAVPVAQDVSRGKLIPGFGLFAVSDNGVLAYRTQPVPAESRLLWLDRQGQEVEILDEGRVHGQAELAPDGRRAAVTVEDPETRAADVWLYDGSRAGVRTRLRLDEDAQDSIFSPVWSPDGRRVAFVSRRQPGYSRTIVASTSGSEPERVLMEGSDLDAPDSWSSDGRLLLFSKISSFRSSSVGGRADLWVFPLEGDGPPRPVLQTSAAERNGQFSPDGRHIAFQSDESGAWEVYVMPYPGPGPRVPVSVGGGRGPRWRGDGREIFYLSDADHALLSASVAVEGDRVEVGTAKKLFDFRADRSLRPTFSRRPFDVSPDGQRFLVCAAERDPEPAPITVVTHWTSLLE